MKENQLQMNADERRLAEMTSRIIGAIFAVSNELGCGFLEKVYENALAIELQRRGMTVQQQHRIDVHYGGIDVGEYVADLLVDATVLIELKATKDLEEAHKAQCINYLKATGLKVCLLVNFGKTRVTIKRFVNLRNTSKAPG